ncbi:MAG: polyprenyl synthetase family protein [Bacteroidales bacterium]|nr:polyprenyl synthetase family protein [Bacteroidales bacterium]
MSEILSEIQQKANETNALILDYIKQNNDIINHDLFPIFEYALEIISVYRERAFIIKTVGSYVGLPSEIMKPLMISAELIILSAYIKDDIIDEAITRDGMKTVHQKYGLKSAILMSDIILGIGYKLIYDSIEKYKLNLELINFINRAYLNLCIGQSKKNINIVDISPEKVERLAFLRAGDIIGTFSSLPALIINDKKLTKSFYDYGRWLGISLQFKNDFEDFSINDTHFDNSNFQDIIFKQPNILLSYFSNHYTSITNTKKKVFDKYWGNQNNSFVSQQDKEQIIELFAEYNIINDAYNHLGKLCENSIHAIKNLKISPEKTTLLEFIKLIYHLN